MTGKEINQLVDKFRATAKELSRLNGEEYITGTIDGLPCLVTRGMWKILTHNAFNFFFLYSFTAN